MAKISVPLSEFVNNGNEVPLTDVVGMAFSAAESGNLDNNAEETKMMSADELEEKAVTGCVVIDNITLAEQDTTSRQLLRKRQLNRQKYRMLRILKQRILSSQAVRHGRIQK